VRVFAGATSFFGVSDLAKLFQFTHKFESKYLDKLVGGTPQEIPDVYKARSPIYHADNIVSALLVSTNIFLRALFKNINKFVTVLI
jgi:dipeptidyl aminopeptidase/acylaminoacyl peptidase